MRFSLGAPGGVSEQGGNEGPRAQLPKALAAPSTHSSAAIEQSGLLDPPQTAWRPPPPAPPPRRNVSYLRRLLLCRPADNNFLEDNFNVAASDAAVLLTHVLLRSGRRVDSRACYAASGALAQRVEGDIVEMLNVAAREVAEDTTLPFELRDLARRIKFFLRCVVVPIESELAQHARATVAVSVSPPPLSRCGLPLQNAAQ